MRRQLRRVLRSLLEACFVTEYIGQEECPMMMRWEFLRIGRKPWVKAMIHYFPPNVTDRDPHDHPRSFITLILRGGYWNMEWEDFSDHPMTIEYLRAGMVRFRRADHMHITETANAGAWTLVIMGPEKRTWGFLREGIWWAWKPYVDRFGGVIRCEEGVSHNLDEGRHD